VLRKTVPARTFSCENGIQGFTGRGWLGWRSDQGARGLILWGKLSLLQASYLTQQLRAWGDHSAGRPTLTIIDTMALELSDGETARALHHLGTREGLNLQADRLVVLAADPSSSTASIAVRSWSTPGQTSILSNPDEIYGPLGITHDSELCEQMKQALNHSPEIDFTRDQLERYVQSHLTSPSIAEACTALQLSRRTLQRRLYEAGVSFQKVVIRTRISCAQSLLAEGNIPITQIAVTVGFATLQAFSSAFRRETGTSPSSYRATAYSDEDGERSTLAPISGVRSIGRDQALDEEPLEEALAVG
jgi:AraC-like DNA-binding protein